MEEDGNNRVGDEELLVARSDKEYWKVCKWM